MKTNNHRIWRFLYKLHRYIGLSSSIVLIMLAITGIALNHTEELKLDSQMVHSKPVLDWYGIALPEHLKSFSTEHHWLTKANQKIYFDQSLLLSNEENLLGAVETNEFIVAALSNSILLITLEGELIEQSPLSGIEKIGLDHNQHIVIKSINGLISSDDGLLSWKPHNDEQIIWSELTQAPESIKEPIENNFRSSILPMERVFLDVHSGRFFGYAGVIVVDISGLLLIILALSGCAIWLKHKFRALRSALSASRKNQ